jgi:hypothetical protein
MKSSVSSVFAVFGEGGFLPIDSKGLRFESKGGEPVVHLIHGKRPAAFYNGAPNYDGGNQWKTGAPNIECFRPSSRAQM